MLLGALQENIITLLAFDKEGAPIVRGAIAIELYGGPYRVIAARCYDYLDRFKQPAGDHLPDLLTDKLEGENKREAQLYVDIIGSIHAVKDTLNREYVLSQLETYIKRQALRSVAVELTKALQRDTEESLEQAEKLIAGSRHNSLSLFDPGTFLNDKKRALRFLDISEQAMPTGIVELDRRGLGPVPKELWLLIANAKRGKCLAVGTLVQLDTGRYIPIENIQDGDCVVSFNEATGVFESKQAQLTANGKKPVLEVKTRSGRTLIVTNNHRLLTKDGWKTVSEISVGHSIAVPLRLAFGTMVASKEYLKILGYMIADGSMSKPHTPTFTKQEKEIVTDLERCLSVYNCALTQAKGAPDHYYVVGKGDRNLVADLLRRDGLMEKKSNQKQLPEWFGLLDKEHTAVFLQALFTCDGSVYADSDFEYSTTSAVLMQQINNLLTRFGIVSKVRERWQTVAGCPYCSWSLLVRGRRQIKKLHEEIGLLGSKGKKLAKMAAGNGSRPDRLSYLVRDQFGEIFFDRVVSIKPHGEAETYDLAVEGTHNFVANNIVVHNSWGLIHLAKMALMHRVRVVHITLEMSEDRCSQRYFQAMLALAKRKDPVQVTKFARDKLGRITDFEDVRVAPAMSMDDPNIRKKLERSIDRWALRVFSNIVVKQFPTGALTVPQLAAYLDNLENTHRFTPELLIVDYPDLMKIDKHNFRLSLDETYKELRGLLIKRNIAGAIVSQSNRSGEKAKQVGLENTAEAYSKVAHADVVITYSQTEEEHKLGLARLHVAAGRNDEDRFTVLISQNYALGNFVVDSAMMTNDYWSLVGRNSESEAEETEEEK